MTVLLGDEEGTSSLLAQVLVRTIRGNTPDGFEFQATAIIP